MSIESCYDDADIAKFKAGAFGAKTGKKRAAAAAAVTVGAGSKNKRGKGKKGKEIKRAKRKRRRAKLGDEKKHLRCKREMG